MMIMMIDQALQPGHHHRLDLGLPVRKRVKCCLRMRSRACMRRVSRCTIPMHWHGVRASGGISSSRELSIRRPLLLAPIDRL